MRMALVSRHYGEYVARYAFSLAEHCETLLLVPAQIRADVETLRDGAVPTGLTVESFDFSDRKRLPSEVWRIAKHVRSFGAGAVHFQEVPDPLTPLLMLACRPSARTILTIHDPAPHSGADSRLPKTAYFGRDLGRAIADAYVVHGAWCRGRLEQARPRNRKPIITSQHGVLMVPPAHRAPDRPPRFLFFGRMEAYKGLDTLLDAADLLAARGFGGTIVVAGRGSDLERHRERIHRTPGVVLKEGFIAAAEAIDLFQTCTAAVMPYRDATQSGVLAAAVGNHRPVIVSAVGELGSFVAENGNGILIPPGDPVALAAAIERLAAPEAAAPFAAAAERAAGTVMNWDRITEDLVRDLKQAAIL